jgi:mono/diheme cytochrome c family protein
MAFAVAALLVVGALFLLLVPRAEAKQKFMSGFAEAFPTAAGTALDSCLLCHTDPVHPRESNLNNFGEDWEDGDFGDKDYLAPNLLNRDSDGDGVSNGAEIQQLSLPGDPSSSAPPTTTTTLPGTPPDGRALYAARCSACHGPNGGDLSGTGLGRTTFISITVDGQGSMPAQSNLTDEEVGAIWEYVTGAAPPTTTTTLPGATTTTTVPASGAEVWSQHCAACHGANGGNVVPTSSSRSQLVSIVTNGVGSMRGFPELGSAQIGNVADYMLSFGPPTTTTTLPGATTTTTTPLGGSALWSQHCAACHGSNGGNVVPTSSSRSRLVSIVTNGVGSMRAFPELGSAQIGNLADYMLSFGTPATTLPGATTTTTIPRSGAVVYASSCALCHGPSGGNLVGHTLSLSEIVSITNAGVGTMPGYSGSLSAAEISNVSQYIASFGASSGVTTTTLPAGTPPSGSTLYMQNCSGCHGLHGEGGPGGAVVGTQLSRSGIISVTEAGTNGMPAYGSELSAAEIAGIADHILGMGGDAGMTGDAGTTTVTTGGTGSGVEAGGEPPPALVEGHALFGQFCAACHGVNGEGGIGGAVAGIEISTEELTDVIRNGVGSMPGFATQMSEVEIGELVAFSAALAADAELMAADTTTTTQGDNGEATFDAADSLGGFVRELGDPDGGGGLSTAVLVAAFFGVVVAGGAVFVWMRAVRNLVG